MASLRVITFAACMISPSLALAEEIGPYTGTWPQPGGAGTAVVISYSFSNLFDGTLLLMDATDLRNATVEALQLWATYAPLHFVERLDSGPVASDEPYAAADHPHMRIGHHPMADLAHAYPPGAVSDGRAGDIHFEPTLPWSLMGRWNFLEAMTHEVGHALGLPHEDGEIAVMNPFFPQPLFGGLGSAFLLPADVRRVQALYGAGQGSVQPLDPVPEPATLVLVAAGLGLLARKRHCFPRANRGGLHPVRAHCRPKGVH